MRFMLFLATFMLISGLSIAGEPVRFFQGLPDIPLMEGLTEVEEEAYIFDKPEGRIAQASATGNGLSKNAIELYYRQSLPQFGWIPLQSGMNAFERKEEILRLETAEGGEDITLRVLIGPRR